MQLLKKKIFVLVFLSLIFNDKSFAIEGPLFQDDKPLELILEVDIQSIVTNKSKEPEYISALLIQKGVNENLSFEIKVRPRGNTRRLTNLCDFPPLKFNFKKSQLSNTVFDGQDKLKFVSQCRQEEKYQGYVLEEYLLYKTYNILTEESYKTRLVNITIKDSNQKVDDIEMSGFLIEDHESLAKRIKTKEYSEVFWSQDSCEENLVDRLSMFQYMIGNTDWYVNTRHNIDVFQSKKDQALIPVPFDFDCSGVIFTEYAQPSDQVSITDVRQRYFKGSCRDIEAFGKTIVHFNEKKEEIYALYKSFDYLPNYVIKQSLRYYTKFYKIINNPDQVASILNGACGAASPKNLKAKK